MMATVSRRDIITGMRGGAGISKDKNASMTKTNDRDVRNRRSHLVILATALAFACPAGSLAFESAYTSIAEGQCRKFDILNIEDNEYAATRVCAGRGGYRVFVDEADLRETLTVGKTVKQAADEPAAHDRYGAFNSYDDRIEWRIGADGKPYALIAGWSFADNANVDAGGRPSSARLLVVMRLPPGPVCKVAYIDLAANTDAHALARDAADKIARAFKCSTDSVLVIGSRGRAIQAILPRPASIKP